MKINRRQFFKFTALGAGAIAIPTFLLPKNSTIPLDLRNVEQGEKYYWVTFNKKITDSHFSAYVYLTVNGETLVIQKGKRILIPARFKECAEHAVYFNKGKYTMRHPFIEHGEGTHAEFVKMLNMV